MRKDTVFFRQTELLLRVLPHVNPEEVFALKGGTAINFFLRNLPRLSVDIDLTYLPVNERTTALTDIDKALLRISERVKKTISGVHTFSKRDREFNLVASLLIRRGDATIKVEPNPVLSGSVFPTQTRVLCQKAQDLFELSFEARTLSFEDLYGGKICAVRDWLTDEVLSRYDLNDRQRQSIPFLKTHDKITNSQYQAECEVAKKNGLSRFGRACN